VQADMACGRGDDSRAREPRDHRLRRQRHLEARPTVTATSSRTGGAGPRTSASSWLATRSARASGSSTASACSAWCG
jgi:hypothetical protein